MLRRSIKTSISNSFFLFGARGTGKSTYVKQHYTDAETLVFDLLDTAVESELLKHPNRLIEHIHGTPNIRRVIIDEVQKLPKLLNLVHLHIEDSKRAGAPMQFILTGSSARKLRRGAANLLAGRAFLYHLYPLTHAELGDAFNLTHALEYGTLPALASLPTPDDKRAYLDAYGRTYLKEEIWNEQIVRKLEPFARFLEVAAQTNGKILNYTKIGRDIGADTKTVQSYYQILEDTLVGFFLPAFHRSIRKRQTMAPKFYFFDTGVKRALDGTLTVPMIPQTYAYGDAFEHFVLLEIMRLNDYLRRDFRLSYFRTHDDAEIDIVIERPGTTPALIEIKSSDAINSSDIKSLERIAADFGPCDCYCFSRDATPKKIGSTHVLPWEQGLAALFSPIHTTANAPSAA